MKVNGKQERFLDLDFYTKKIIEIIENLLTSQMEKEKFGLGVFGRNQEEYLENREEFERQVKARGPDTTSLTVEDLEQLNRNVDYEEEEGDGNPEYSYRGESRGEHEGGELDGGEQEGIEGVEGFEGVEGTKGYQSPQAGSKVRRVQDRIRSCV